MFLLTFLTFLGSNCQDILFSIYFTYILMQTLILSPNMWLKMKRILVMPFSRFSKVRTLLKSSVFAYFFNFLDSNCQDILFRIYCTYILMQTVILSPNMWLRMKRKLVMPFFRFSNVRTLLNSSVFVFIFDLLGWKLSYYYL